MTPRVTLLTDFGTADGYAAAMKGVMAAIAPAAVFDDAAHDVAPGDVLGAALALSRYWRLYPPGTVHLVVVDPGVGGERRAIAAEVDGRFFVAPDNGVLSRVLKWPGADASNAASSGEPAVVEAPPGTLHVVELRNRDFQRDEVSSTFHGRDIFAPAAAHLAAGVALEKLGPPLSDPVRLDWPAPGRKGGLQGEVLHVDRFGNLITNVPAEWLEPEARVELGGRDVGPVRSTYSDVEPGAVLALVGSAGLLEVSVRDGSAATVLGAGRGAGVVVT